MSQHRLAPALVLLAVTAIFGWTFVVVKEALAQYPVLPFLGLRFGLAALLLLFLLRTWPGRASWRRGLPVAAALAIGYLCQTEGMVTISAGIAGLLTGLFVVFTPLLDRLLFGAHLRPRTLLSIALALLGTGLLTGGVSGFRSGDLLVVVSAVAFAAQIVLLSHGRGSVAEMSLVQMLVCALVFLLLGAGPRLDYPPVSGSVAIALVITGALASGLAVLAQTWAQRHISASRAGLMLAAEPGFALLFAVLLVGERLAPVQLLGALLVLLAIVGHEVLVGLRGGES
ncbi:MAG: DMT family transporter [Candidatus Dormibacteria bacterium]